MRTKASSLLSFVRCDPDDISDILSRRYAPVRIDPIEKDGIVSLSGRFGRLPGLHFSRSEIDDGFRLTPQKKIFGFCFMFPQQGIMNASSSGRLVTVNERFAFCSDGSECDFLQFESGYRHRSVTVEKNLMRERLALILDRPVTRKIVFTALVDRTKSRIALLESLLDVVNDGQFCQSIAEMPFASARMSQTLVDFLLDIWPHNFTEDLHRKPPSIAPRHVRLVKDYIDSHPDAPMTTDDLARLAGVSIRALQYGFRDFLGMSISEYGRRARLEGARKAILSNEGLSVAEVAKLWGFSNAHRFNRDFKLVFGVTPGDMKRGQSSG